MTDAAVQSIRIAKTLTDRFLVLMNPGITQLDTASLELRIGEAQQIYPEIWSHLDGARGVLAGRGVDCSAFDAVRAEEPKGSIGVSRVEVEQYSTTTARALIGYQDGQIKTAEFNLEGYRRAARALQALMRAMPEVDWAAHDRAEAADLRAAGSLGPVNPRSALRWVLIGGGGLLAVYLFWFFVVRVPKPDYKAERKRHIAELTAKLDAAPCDKDTLDYLTNEEYWDDPPVKDHKPTIERYTKACQAVLDRDPCNNEKLRQLKLIGGKRAIQPYLDLCNGSGARVAP